MDGQEKQLQNTVSNVGSFPFVDLWAQRYLSAFLRISSDTYHRSMIIASIVLFPSSYFIQSNNELVHLLANPHLHDTF